LQRLKKFQKWGACHQGGEVWLLASKQASIFSNRSIIIRPTGSITEYLASPFVGDAPWHQAIISVRSGRVTVKPSFTIGFPTRNSTRISINFLPKSRSQPMHQGLICLRPKNVFAIPPGEVGLKVPVPAPLRESLPLPFPVVSSNVLYCSFWCSGEPREDRLLIVIVPS
jgi:hypothetical protein